jgi:integrase
MGVVSGRGPPPPTMARETLPAQSATTTRQGVSSRSWLPEAPTREKLPSVEVTPATLTFCHAKHTTTRHSTTRIRTEPTHAAEAGRPGKTSRLDAGGRKEGDALTNRRIQVDMLRRGDRFPAVVTAWPQPTSATIDKWRARHPAFKTTTEGYQSTQTRMMWLLEEEHDKRVEAFERECWTRNLKPTTAESYWTSWLSACKAIGEEVSLSDQAHQKLLKKRAEAHPRDYPKAATLKDIQRMLDLRPDRKSYTTIIALAFKLGQRISDMIQLDATSINIQNHDDRPRLAIDVKIGKVIGKIGPYTLWLNIEDPIARQLLALRQRATEAGRPFLLSYTNSNEERTRVSDTVRDIIRTVDADLELRSIRRGGLQLMANAGVPTAEILKLSKHSEEKMLLRYLDNGKMAAADAATMIDAAKHATLRL